MLNVPIKLNQQPQEGDPNGTPPIPPQPPHPSISVHLPVRRAPGEMETPPRAYQRVERRGVRPVGHIVPVALAAGVGSPVHPQRGGGAQLVPGGGQQAALVHGAVHRGLRGRCHAGVRQGSAGGFAASGQRVGCHQELHGGGGGGGEPRMEKKEFSFFFLGATLMRPFG